MNMIIARRSLRGSALCAVLAMSDTVPVARTQDASSGSFSNVIPLTQAAANPPMGAGEPAGAAPGAAVVQGQNVPAVAPHPLRDAVG